MAEATGQERTEEPTARRLQKARKEGQIARSTEAPAAAVVIGALLAILLSGTWMAQRLTTGFASGFTFDRKTLDTPSLMLATFGDQLLQGFLVILPVMLVTVLMAITAAGLSGGFMFSPDAAAPKASKLSPLAGFKRMFGLNALVELAKALLKFALVGGALWLCLALRMDDILRIGEMALEPAMALAATLLLQCALVVSMALALIALIDVPWQRYSFMKRMRMTRQEIKDEMKDMEGRPEVKAQIRKRQREMANARMLKRVKDADVVITNPEHFAVALEYDPTSNGAPVLVAKGSDFMAAKIREEAANAGVHLFAAPELARALYFTTEAEHPVPEALYHAVAQVIAYVFSLEGAQPGRAGMRRPHPVVPPSMRFDADGRRLEAETETETAANAAATPA